jgi:hypothetical protein
VIDLAFTIGVPITLIVYSRKQKSAMILIYLYIELMMGLYCFYTRFRSQIETRSSTKQPDDTDFIRQVSLTLTIMG